MTKKAQKIINKYQENLNANTFLYEKQLIDFSLLQKSLNKESKEFESLVTSMFHYDLLSEKDFLEMFPLAFELRCKAIDKVMGR